MRGNVLVKVWRCLPNDEVIVSVVDKSRSTSVRVVLEIFWRLEVIVLESEVDGLVG